jgi:putative alpha-1,2-mannosidase
LAAWYVFSAIGLYPWPCFPGYYITTPIFDEVTVHLPGGDLKIEAQGASQGLRYIRSATFNGQALDELWIEHDKIVDGGLLVLMLDENPHTQINDGPQ